MKDKIIDRIRKLLSLSKSANEHEAGQAAALAADLMLTHEIEEAALCDPENAPESVGSDTLDELGRQRIPWKGTLAHALTQAHGCKSYSETLKTTGKVVIQIVGQPSKVATIRYMYQYLTGEVVRLANKAYGEEARECAASNVPAPSARAWKNAFRLGASQTIGRRLMDQRKVTHEKARLAGSGTALVVVKAAEEAVQKYIKSNVKGLRPGRQAQYSSRSGFGAGRAAGRNVSLGGGKGLRSGGRAKMLGS